TAPAPEIKTLPPLTMASAPTPVPVNPTPVPVTKVETLPPGKRILQNKSKTKWRFTPIAKWGHTDPATLKSVEIKSSSIPSPTPVLPSPTPAPVPEATTRDPILTSK
ncbi:mucin-7-like, partial [Temnothorax curvispinosus]|uniref:Mucin-7-like n=1 Tax=Temnothorax curvispinosus TaxID=300111 RepID=A0A6J1PQA0_9HYME